MRFIWWPQTPSCQAWGLVLTPCEGVGISDRAHPAAPQRITTVGIPPAVGLRLVLMPVSLKCCSAANFFGLVPLPFLYCCRFLNYTAVVLSPRPGPTLLACAARTPPLVCGLCVVYRKRLA